LTANTTITVQPVENHCPAGSGLSYLITPHDLAFKKPVRLTMNYGDSDVVNSIPVAMCIGYQDAAGKWNAAGNMTKDTVHGTVSVLTDHFSSWSLFQVVRMFPASTMVEPGGTVNLQVEKYSEVGDDLFIPIPGPLEKKISIVKEWTLAGAGKIEPNADKADYLAPSAIPAKIPIAVTATLNTKGTAKYMLVSNIYIGKEGLTFRIDNGQWLHGGTTGVLFTGYNNSVSAGVENTPQADGVTMTFMGDIHYNEFVRWRFSFPSWVYGEQPTISYSQLLATQGRVSPGGIYFNKCYHSTTEPYVIGTFTLSPAQKVVTGGIPDFSTHNIEGFFKVKWQ
jgi:hypothetical protein